MPERFKQVIETPNLNYLSDEGLYRRFDPEPLVQDYRTRKELAEEFRQRLDSPEFAEEMTKPSSGRYWNIAFEKMTYDSWRAVVDRHLTPDQSSMDGWIRVKEPAATIYMGMLARYLASKDPQYVQPSTDHAEYEDIIYRCGSNSEPLPGMALSLKNLLPRVAPDTELREVVGFRNQRREELLYLRRFVDEVQTKLSKCESQEEAKLVITQFQEQLELGAQTIQRVMKERGIRCVVGTLRTIFSAKSSAWLALLGGGAGTLGGDPMVAVVSGAAGYVAGGAIELANYVLDARVKNRVQQESPFSYLYSAKQEGII
ncbi:MAG: hypothetical protein DDT37_01815 [Firmicutes bacterium]|nr:hypothetical protein [candidate division NPL-UPA2 bacterium]